MFAKDQTEKRATRIGNTFPSSSSLKTQPVITHNLRSYTKNHSRIQNGAAKQQKKKNGSMHLVALNGLSTDGFSYPLLDVRCTWFFRRISLPGLYAFLCLWGHCTLERRYVRLSLVTDSSFTIVKILLSYYL